MLNFDILRTHRKKEKIREYLLTFYKFIINERLPLIHLFALLIHVVTKPAV
ncbi:MAG: hypothetical protein Ct9H300mP21_04050 [Pseudomonadota bacterium]|nr:MAG: hypothetical protein Ct9H300mP21_04050 [Pseudomonadota bacterium]